MHIVAIADTHGKHDQLRVPPGDLLIHAGDVTIYGHSGDLKDFLKWFAAQPHEHKIFIAGNHDWIFEREPARARELIKRHAPDVIYLENEGTMIDGWKIWGSPITPNFMNWAFNRGLLQRRGLWSTIPDDTNILLTHGPVYEGRDKAPHGEHAGDGELLKRVQEVAPVFHICGHIHCGYGKAHIGCTTEINCSVVNEAYEVVNQPVEFILKSL